MNYINYIYIYSIKLHLVDGWDHHSEYCWRKMSNHQTKIGYDEMFHLTSDSCPVRTANCWSEPFFTHSSLGTTILRGKSTIGSNQPQDMMLSWKHIDNHQQERNLKIGL